MANQFHFGRRHVLDNAIDKALAALRADTPNQAHRKAAMGALLKAGRHPRRQNLTRPLGALVGDFLGRPLSAVGLALSRYSTSAPQLAVMLTAILLLGQRAAGTAHC